MDIFDSRYYRVHRCLLKFVGQWPYQAARRRTIHLILLYLSIGTLIILQVLSLIQLWGNIELMVEVLVPAGVQVVGLIKTSNSISNHVKMKRLMDLIKKDWSSAMDMEERKMLLSYVEQGYIFGLMYGGCIFGSVIIYQIIPVMPQILDIALPLNETRPRQFLYRTDYTDNAEDYYSLIMIHNYIGTTVTVIIIIAVDMMLIAYVNHICGMFTIIGQRLENTLKDTDRDVIVETGVDSDKVYGHIAKCINDHEEAIEFACLIEESYSMTFLFQIGISMLLISATGLQVVTKLGKPREVFRLTQFIIGQLLHLFFASLSSQIMMNHSLRFRDSLYFAEWYRFPLRGRHLLRLAMLRSLKPCKITAGKIYDMSFESFAKVVQTSMSYFTVLVSMR